jgi:hypothetical protein
VAGALTARKVFPADPAAPAAIVIPPRPSPGAGVYIDDYSNPHGSVGLQIGLVHTSKHCTGS